MYRLCLFFILISFASCGTRDDKNEFYLIKSSSPLKLSEFFSSISTRSLNSEEVIGSIDKMIVHDSLILISDFMLMQSLKIFDKNGTQVAYNDNIGEGPLGLSEITDFGVFNDTIYVLDAYQRKFLRFDLKLELIDEYDVPVSCNNFLINQDGIFLLRQGEDAETGRLIRYSHQMEFISNLIPSNEMSTQIVISSTNLFIPIDDTSFITYNPLYPYIWIYKNQKIEKLELDFNNQFIEIKQLAKMEPLKRLRYVNSYEDFYNLSNGIKLSSTKFLFSIRYQKKNGYLKVDLSKMQLTFFNELKNDLMMIPSTISFSGNSKETAWYWMNQEDLGKFYYINDSKIPLNKRIELGSDDESKYVFQLKYNQ